MERKTIAKLAFAFGLNATLVSSGAVAYNPVNSPVLYSPINPIQHTYVLDDASYIEDIKEFLGDRAATIASTATVSLENEFDEPLGDNQSNIVQLDVACKNGEYTFKPVHVNGIDDAKIVDFPSLAKDRDMLSYNGRPLFFVDDSHIGEQLYYCHNGKEMALFQQDDPRWIEERAPMPYNKKGEREYFSKNGCGHTITASILSLVDKSITPYSLVLEYFPDYAGGGTVDTKHKEILKEAGFDVTDYAYQGGKNKKENTVSWIKKELDDDGLVVILTGTNFHYTTTDHYVMAVGYDDKGEILIHDPMWGLGETTIDDLALDSPFSVYSVKEHKDDVGQAQSNHGNAAVTPGALDSNGYAVVGQQLQRAR